MISIGQDPLYSRYPVRGFRVDIALAGSPRLTLEALVGAITAMDLDPAAARDRRAKWAALGKKRRDDLEQQALAVRDRRPIAKPWFTRCLAEHLGDDTILLNELGVDLAQTIFTKPGQFYGVAVSGGLGWGVGAALGAKLAAPDKTVVCCVGDGSYIFGSATAGHMVSMAQNLPVLTIVWNNGIWGAVQNATRRLAPGGLGRPDRQLRRHRPVPGDELRDGLPSRREGTASAWRTRRRSPPPSNGGSTPCAWRSARRC